MAPNGSPNRVYEKSVIWNVRRTHMTIKVTSIVHGAVSNVIAVACKYLMNKEINDDFVLNSAIDASLYAKTTITGAYDDSTACYYGGFVTTDNYKRKILKRENSPTDISVVLYLPNNKKRGDVTRLKLLSDIYLEAFQLAYSGQYWKAMTLNGVLTSALIS